MRGLVAVVAVAAGCASPAATLKVNGDLFQAGQHLPGELVNASSFYELRHGVFCLAYLERRENGEAWARAPEPERACILPLLITAPGATVVFQYLLDAALPRGEYRLRFEVARGRLRLFGLGVGGAGASVTLASPPFTVREKPAPR